MNTFSTYDSESEYEKNYILRISIDLLIYPYMSPWMYLRIEFYINTFTNRHRDKEIERLIRLKGTGGVKK